MREMRMRVRRWVKVGVGGSERYKGQERKHDCRFEKISRVTFKKGVGEGREYRVKMIWVGRERKRVRYRNEGLDTIPLPTGLIYKFCLQYRVFPW